MGRDWGAVFGVADEADLFEHFECGTYRGREYRYLPAARHGVERGTAVLGDTVVRGFPSIPRVLVLDPGLVDFFDGPVTVEEKLNGYNVRVAEVPGSGRTGATADRDGDDGEWADAGPLAFTRSGRVCRYTTAVVREQCDLAAFFADHPTLQVCGELVGPENPYTAHDYDEVDSVAFRAFDLRERATGDPLPVDERRALCEAYGFEQVRSFGTYEPAAAVDAVADAIEELDERGREGVVLTSADGERRLKYTTSAIHRSDLAHAFALPFDYGRDFVFSRVIREVFQAVERDESPAATRERARRLGESILLPAVRTVRAVDRGEVVGEDHRVRGDPAVLDALLAQFRDQGLDVRVRADRREGDERVVEFVKRASATRDKTAHYLDGGTVDE
ncbi:ATP dependent DNA ligase [Halosimplex carlsbadense 2-9-1]|uniref:ATP dependent DNA ligase n=1 Tax=Halosimplex carlsbadense 2-9-1 TaxID=797114 RepID=M0CX91_9EURY|nr:RNA ligase [Halosimplex carlsbadense]ELZ27856.1 ATP dependent DNA ligase [Halosimplex carlsbadense 2-9-1]